MPRALFAFIFGLALPLLTHHATAEPNGPANFPDYVAQINEQARGDLANADNAFVALLPLFDLTPDRWDPENLAGLLRELGLDRDAIETPGPTLIGWSDWAQDQLPDEDERDAIESAILDGPWSPDEQPLADAWLDEQADTLTAVEAAVRRPGYYAPFVRNEQADAAWDASLPHLGQLRSIARSLQARAHRDVARGDTDAVLGTIESLRRLADGVRHQPMILPGLVAISIDSIAAHVARELLAATPLTGPQAQRLAASFPTIPSGLRIADTIDRSERAFTLDFIDLAARRRADDNAGPLAGWILEDEGVGPAFQLTDHSSFDRDRAKAQLNSAYDQVAAALAQPDLADVLAAHRPIKERLEAYEPAIWVNAAFFEPRNEEEAEQKRAALADVPAGDAYTDEVVRVLEGIFLPTLDSAAKTERQVDARRTLTRLAAFLEAHRVRHGQYPAGLDALVPILQAPLPRDLDGQPFRYTPTADLSGYTLRSVGQHTGAEEPLADTKRELLTITVQR